MLNSQKDDYGFYRLPEPLDLGDTRSTNPNDSNFSFQEKNKKLTKKNLKVFVLLLVFLGLVAFAFVSTFTIWGGSKVNYPRGGLQRGGLSGKNIMLLMDNLKNMGDSNYATNMLDEDENGNKGFGHAYLDTISGKYEPDHKGQNVNANAVDKVKSAGYGLYADYGDSSTDFDDEEGRGSDDYNGSQYRFSADPLENVLKETKYFKPLEFIYKDGDNKELVHFKIVKLPQLPSKSDMELLKNADSILKGPNGEGSANSKLLGDSGSSDPVASRITTAGIAEMLGKIEDDMVISPNGQVDRIRAVSGKNGESYIERCSFDLLNDPESATDQMCDIQVYNEMKQIAEDSLCKCNSTVEGESYHYKYSTEEFGRFMFSQIGRQFSDVQVVHTDESEYKIEIKINYSSSDIKNSVVVSETQNTKNTPKLAAFRIKAPHRLGKGQCINTSVVFHIPKSVKELPLLANGFVTGNLSIEKNVIDDVHFGKFYFGTVYTRSSFDGLKAHILELNSVYGDVRGSYSVSCMVKSGTLRSPVDLDIDIIKQNSTSASREKITSNRGRDRNSIDGGKDFDRCSDGSFHIASDSFGNDVNIKVSNNFDGSFRVVSILQHTTVSKTEDGELRFVKDTDKYKSGTFSPKQKDNRNSKNLGYVADSIRLGSFKGNTTLTFK